MNAEAGACVILLTEVDWYRRGARAGEYEQNREPTWMRIKLTHTLHHRADRIACFQAIQGVRPRKACPLLWTEAL